MLVRAGLVVVLVTVNASGFRPVLARGWHSVPLGLLLTILANWSPKIGCGTKLPFLVEGYRYDSRAKS